MYTIQTIEENSKTVTVKTKMQAARELGVPYSYMNKVLSDMSKRGVTKYRLISVNKFLYLS